MFRNFIGIGSSYNKALTDLCYKMNIYLKNDKMNTNIKKINMSCVQEDSRIYKVYCMVHIKREY